MISHIHTLFEVISIPYENQHQTLNIKKIDRGQIRFRDYWITLLQPVLSPDLWISNTPRYFSFPYSSCLVVMSLVSYLRVFTFCSLLYSVLQKHFSFPVILHNKIKNKSCDKLATPPPLTVAMGISFLISSDRSAIADVSLAITVLWLILWWITYKISKIVDIIEDRQYFIS